MNILHLVAGELTGGAARGAYWLHQGLREIGVESRVLTTSRETYNDPTVISLVADKQGKIFDALRRQADLFAQKFYPRRKEGNFSAGLCGYDFTRSTEYREADIIHMHWICSGMINVRHLDKVDKPIVWTMRDMWPMTGGCHYAMDCRRYESGCGLCPQLQSKSKRDLSFHVLSRKRKFIPRNTTLVGISGWLSECARQSWLYQEFDIHTIHNNVNTDVFFPVNQNIARQVLGLPTDKPIVLAASHNLNVFYKGLGLYLEATESLQNDPLFLFFGSLSSETTKLSQLNYISMGVLHDSVSLRLAYSAADVFVAPSTMDAFGKTIAEAMACGTPAVCFDATGPKGIVDHKVNGYKAQGFKPKDMGRGIDWVLDHPDRKMLSKNAREKIVRTFDSKVIANEYAELYESILRKNS